VLEAAIGAALGDAEYTYPGKNTLPERKVFIVDPEIETVV
jgi:hypothetical protein